MIKTLAKSIREYKRASVAAPLYMVGEVCMETLIPLLMAKMIDEMTGETMSPILYYGIALVGMALLSLWFGVMSAKKASEASCGFAKNLRHDLFYRIMELSFSDVDRFSSSSLVTRMTTDITNIQNAYGMIIRMAVRVPLMFLFSIIMGCLIHWKLTMIFVAVAIPLGILILAISKKVFAVFHRIFKKYDSMNNSVQENVSAIRVVKSYVREGYEIKRFGERSEDVCQEFTYAEKILALFQPIMSFCINFSTLILCYFAAQIIINTSGNPVPELTTGGLSSLTMYGVQILAGLMMLGFAFVMISMSVEAIRRVTEVLEYSPSLKNTENGLTEVPDGSISFRNVSFRYSENAKRYALEDINLEIKSGQTVGIIGSTGSSKSTLIQLISRLYDTTEGVVTVGGHDVRDYDLDALRNQVAVVLQKNVLFSGTIKDNLRWGNEFATDDELIAACRAACADEFIQSFPDGYDTHIEQGGTNVSGGQKQRLCIARALLKNPKVLILDDSTSAVDTRTDAMIRSAFKDLIPGTTKLIIAQRVSSVEDADLILVMENGRIAEQGTSEELVRLGGIYADIYKAQTLAKEA